MNYHYALVQRKERSGWDGASVASDLSLHHSFFLSFCVPLSGWGVDDVFIVVVEVAVVVTCIRN